MSEIPCRVSSDLHEWYNDVDTVSMGSSAKLCYRCRRRFPVPGRKDPGNFTVTYHWITEYSA